MALIKQPFIQLNMSDGTPYAGAKAYFYQTGGVIAASVFQDSALSVAHAVPVVADSEGRFPAMFAPASPALRMKVISATGSLVSPLLDIDPVNDEGDNNANSLVKTARAAATANVTVANPGTATFDGVVLAVGDKLFLPVQTTGSQNGVYDFNGASIPLTRSDGSDTSATMSSDHTVTMEEGTLYADVTFKLTTNAPITLGITSLAYRPINLLPTRQKLVAGTAATYTLPPYCRQIRVTVQGPGGGGGSKSGTASSGSSGASASSFHGITAVSGTGGQSNGNAGAGGTGGSDVPTSGSVKSLHRTDGNAGSPGANATGATAANGGIGGAGRFGGGTTNTNSAKANSGSGGSGQGVSSAAEFSGGGGGAGENVEFWIDNPLATYLYTIGPGGAAGTGAGNGGSGIVLVEEIYL